MLGAKYEFGLSADLLRKPVIHANPRFAQTIRTYALSGCASLPFGVRRKLTAHLSACRSTGADFIPLVAETLGGLAEDTIQTVAAIGRAIDNRSGPSDPSSTSKHLFGRLAMPCGVTMPAFGCTATHLSLHLLTVLCESFLFCAGLFCFVLSCLLCMLS